MEKKSLIRQDTVYGDSVKRLGHWLGWWCGWLVAVFDDGEVDGVGWG